MSFTGRVIIIIIITLEFSKDKTVVYAKKLSWSDDLYGCQALGWHFRPSTNGKEPLLSSDTFFKDVKVSYPPNKFSSRVDASVIATVRLSSRYL